MGEHADPPKPKTCFRLRTQKHTCRHGGVIDVLSSKSKFLLLRNGVQSEGHHCKGIFPMKMLQEVNKNRREVLHRNGEKKTKQET